MPRQKSSFSLAHVHLTILHSGCFHVRALGTHFTPPEAHGVQVQSGGNTWANPNPIVSAPSMGVVSSEHLRNYRATWGEAELLYTGPKRSCVFFVLIRTIERLCSIVDNNQPRFTHNKQRCVWTITSNAYMELC